MKKPYDFDYVSAVLLELEDHERARAGRPCGCVKCRILAELDDPVFKPPRLVVVE